jgi:hypothetical protein
MDANGFLIGYQLGIIPISIRTCGCKSSLRTTADLIQVGIGLRCVVVTATMLKIKIHLQSTVSPLSRTPQT